MKKSCSGGGPARAVSEVVSSKVSVKLRQEEATSRDHAAAHIYDGEKLVITVVAKVELKTGVDGGRYPCVTLVEHKY